MYFLFFDVYNWLLCPKSPLSLGVSVNAQIITSSLYATNSWDSLVPKCSDALPCDPELRTLHLLSSSHCIHLLAHDSQHTHTHTHSTYHWVHAPQGSGNLEGALRSLSEGMTHTCWAAGVKVKFRHKDGGTETLSPGARGVWEPGRGKGGSSEGWWRGTNELFSSPCSSRLPKIHTLLPWNC